MEIGCFGSKSNQSKCIQCKHSGMCSPYTNATFEEGCNDCNFRILCSKSTQRTHRLEITRNKNIPCEKHITYKGLQDLNIIQSGDITMIFLNSKELENLFYKGKKRSDLIG